MKHYIKPQAGGYNHVRQGILQHQHSQELAVLKEDCHFEDQEKKVELLFILMCVNRSTLSQVAKPDSLA